MQINLTGHHVDVTESLKGYVETKFERLARHFDHVLDIHVILSVEKLRQKAEATLHVNGGKVFADSVHEDMYAAIDALIDKLDRQVLKHKQKKRDHRGNGHRALDQDPETVVSVLLADPLDAPCRPQPPTTPDLSNGFTSYPSRAASDVSPPPHRCRPHRQWPGAEQ